MSKGFSGWRFAYRRALRAWRLRPVRAAAIGAGVYVDPTVQVYGWSRIRIGRQTVLCEDVLINASNRVSDEITLTIGDYCFIGRRNYFNVGARLRLGDYCLTANDVRFIGTDHRYESPFVPYAASGVEAEAVIDVGANCWLGLGVTVLKGVRIGYGSIIGAGAVVTRNVPPLSIVVGNPGRVVKRFDVPAGKWRPASEYLENLPLPEEEEYVARLRASHSQIALPVSGASRRFGDF